MGTNNPAGDGQGAAESSEPTNGFTRRWFLLGSGAVGGVAAYEASVAQAKLLTNPGLSAITAKLPSSVQSLLGEIESILSDTKPTFSLVLRRREDFLFLRVDGYNLVRHGQRLERDISSGDAYVVFTFEPQHVSEQAFPLNKTPATPGKSQARLAYPSRIAFSVPSGRSVPLTVAGLLDWARLDPSLSPSAAYETGSGARAHAKAPGHGVTTPVHAPVHLPTHGKPPRLANPTDVQTAIELPWRLVISPTAGGGAWSHPRKVVASRGYSELWHTRLANGPGPAAPDGGVIRAVWNYDTDATNNRPTLQSNNPPSINNESPFITSLTEWDRWEIVNASSNFGLAGRADVTAHRLWLSTRGGFLDSVGDWESTSFDLAEWKHQATLGRDQYVKVVVKGFLFPFGHRAVYTTVSEREFEKVDGEIVATFRQYSYVVIRQPTVSYDPADTYGIANDSRDFPFRSLTITTPRTPDIKTPPPAFVSSSHFEGNPFIPMVGGKEFLWHFIGTDWLGQQAEFTAPAVFVYQQDGFNADNCEKVRAKYNGLAVTSETRIGNFTGQEVAFAESRKAGDTNHSVLKIVFGAGRGTGPKTGGLESAFKSHDQPICYPTLTRASVVLSAAAQASGGTPLASNPEVSYHSTFVDHGFNSAANKGNLYLEILGTGPALNFSGASSGGVITPNLSLTGLSRSLGPVAGSLDNLLDGKFDPASVFANALNATILGGVKLSTLIKAVTDITGDDPPAQAMQIVYSTAADAASSARSGEELPRITPPEPLTRTTHFHWEPEIDPSQSIPIVTSTGDTQFVLDGVVTANLAKPQDSTFELTGNLTNFAVSLMEADGAAEFITITFNSLTFTASSGQKSGVTVDIANVGFDGPLKFIEQLEDYMDFSGDGGPKITVTPAGIAADLSVALPPIGVGVFSLSNIAIDAGFNLPFVGGPARFRFSFSTQDNPFTLSVAIFGGGGFFGIAIGTDGVELIQASFDFGAMASIDLGVASGSVELVAGIYFSYGENNGQPPTTCILTGFVKLDGSLSILDIISLSLTFDLSLTYEDAGGVSSVTGTATLTVSVSVLFFSFSVSVTATKTFGGGASDSSAQLRHSLPHLPGAGAGSDSPPNFQSQVPNQATWNTYCAAFATN
jgi:hypothetical protein